MNGAPGFLAGRGVRWARELEFGIVLVGRKAVRASHEGPLMR
jgi:hypothetical protein